METSRRPRPSFARATSSSRCPAVRFFRSPRRLGDHALELLHLLAQLALAPCEFLLLLVERRPVLRRALAHERSLPASGHPKEQEKREETEEDQRQGDRETDLQPLHETVRAAERDVRRRFRQGESLESSPVVAERRLRC